MRGGEEENRQVQQVDDLADILTAEGSEDAMDRQDIDVCSKGLASVQGT